LIKNTAFPIKIVDHTHCGRRVLRGGSWDSTGSLRAASRDINDAGNRNVNRGFRVARTLP